MSALVNALDEIYDSFKEKNPNLGTLLNNAQDWIWRMKVVPQKIGIKYVWTLEQIPQEIFKFMNGNKQGDNRIYASEIEAYKDLILAFGQNN